jgi:hypothetical protein
LTCTDKKDLFRAELFTPLQKAPSSRRGLNAFCQSRDVAFWKGASGSCRRGSTAEYLLSFAFVILLCDCQIVAVDDFIIVFVSQNLTDLSGFQSLDFADFH